MSGEGEDVYKKRDEMWGEMHSDIKHMVKWTESHDTKDDKRFAEVDKRLAMSEKIIYGCTGVFIFVEFMVKFFK